MLPPFKRIELLQESNPGEPEFETSSSIASLLPRAILPAVDQDNMATVRILFNDIFSGKLLISPCCLRLMLPKTSRSQCERLC